MKRVLILTFGWLLSVCAIAQSHDMKGVVKDSSGEPIIGASILEAGTINGTITDLDGNFSVKVSPSATLIVTYVGYQTQSLQVDNQKFISITLQDDNELLDEVVVVGYGVQKKSSVTASVASISSKEMQKQVNSNVASALIGQTAGVEILQNGGEAGGDVKILIRGAGTFGETEPLYVIDGAFSNNGLNSINPADISSIEILKDGSAAAIYGSRAANGVVLVTTKQGAIGTEPIISISGSYSYQTPSKQLDFMNASQWREYANMVSENSPTFSTAAQNVNPTDPNRSTDWQDVYFQNAPVVNLNAGISGGGKNTTYNLSLGYLDQEGIVVNSKYQKYNARLNSSYKKGRLTINENLSISHSKKDPQSGSRFILIPTIEAQDDQGRWVSTSGNDGYSIDGMDIVNPLAAIYASDEYIKTTDVTGNVAATLNILKGLNYKLNVSGSYLAVHDYTHTPTYGSYWDEDGGINTTIDGSYQLYTSLEEARSESFNYTVDNLLTYNKEIGKHSVDALLGTSWTREYYRMMSIDTGLADLGNPTITTYNGDGTIGSEAYSTALLSTFARLNYDYDNKYLLSASIRSDKSSKFADGYNVGYFPSVSAGWNVHNESFFNVPQISQLKVRGSYGQLGANFISPYSFVSTAYGPVPVVFGGERQYGYITYFAQESLTWETCESSNIAVELGFLDNALTFTAEYYNKKNIDLLAPLQSLPSAGQTIVVNEGDLPYYNTASVQNTGFEFLAGYRKSWNDFTLNLQGNITFLDNEVLALGEGVQPIYGSGMSSKFTDSPTITDVGLPIGTFWGYVVEGIDENGDFMFEDIDDDGTADKQVIGNPTPDFNYGLNVNLGYKNWDLSMFFQGTYGNDIFNGAKYQYYFNYSNNALTDAMNAWTSTNTDTNIPIAKTDNYTGGNSLPSTFYIEDGSYLRLKNLQVGYTLNDKTLNKLSLKGARVYAGVQNLFTITNYSGYDPEVNSNTLFDRGTDGLQDDAPAVNARTFTLGFNLSF